MLNLFEYDFSKTSEMFLTPGHKGEISVIPYLKQDFKIFLVTGETCYSVNRLPKNNYEFIMRLEYNLETRKYDIPYMDFCRNRNLNESYFKKIMKNY